jgi:hypothetical protein
MSIELLASILLLALIGSMTFIFMVLIKQWRLLKVPIEPEVNRFRKVLFMLSLAIFLGNFVPIFIDAATLFVETGRPTNLKAISVAYAFSNALTSLCSSFLIWLLYKLASDSAKLEDNDLRPLKNQ